MNNKILVTIPSLQEQGGVASYFNSLLPYLGNSSYNIYTLQIGKTSGQNKQLHRVTDQFRFRKTIINYLPSLVHINPTLDPKSFIRDGFFILQAKQKKIPVLVFFHGWQKNFESVVGTKLLGLFMQTFGKADGFVVLASEFENKLREWGITKPIHIRTTAVDESLLDGFLLEEKIKRIKISPEVSILFLARLEREKGVFETVDAFSLLLKKGLPLKLSIAGDGPIRAELINYVKYCGLSNENVKFLGHVSGNKKIKAFVEHDIYCMPTTHGEGLPASVIEAMAFGMPVITRPVGGLADFFEDGRMGYLCKSKEPIAIARLLEKLIINKDKLIEVGHFNHNYSKEKFMASNVAKNILSIYKSLLLVD